MSQVSLGLCVRQLQGGKPPTWRSLAQQWQLTYQFKPNPNSITVTAIGTTMMGNPTFCSYQRNRESSNGHTSSSAYCLTEDFPLGRSPFIYYYVQEKKWRETYPTRNRK